MTKEETKEYLAREYKLKEEQLTKELLPYVLTKNIDFIFYSSTGAMGIPARLAIITEDKILYSCNYVKSEIDPGDTIVKIRKKAKYIEKYLGCGNILIGEEKLLRKIEAIFEPHPFRGWVFLSTNLE